MRKALILTLLFLPLVAQAQGNAPILAPFYAPTAPGGGTGTVTKDAVAGAAIDYSTSRGVAIAVADHTKRVIIALVACDANTLTGVADDQAHSFTQYGSVYVGDSFWIWVYYYVAPAVGSRTITASFSNADGAGRVEVYSLYEANQSSPIRDDGAATEGGGGPTTLEASVTSAVNDLVVDLFIVTGGGASAASGQTLEDSGGDYVARSSSKAGEASSTTTGYTGITGNLNKVMRNVAVQP